MSDRLIINCTHAGERCALKGIDLRGSVCAGCGERVAREDRPEPIWFVTVKGRNANEAREGEYKLCKPRLKEEWNEEWQTKILASVIRSTSTCHFIPVATWEEAKAFRK